ncbi:Uncharacterised protein [Legionella busanensis]|uniref:Uncharacterized protein n=1 Tax=Legionella busanensis TaxID=190655 RepID=A0A378JL46_9GAMM|nr:hypothetical protein [Legionella busanensis]STX52056.1 Uncharacterised protein [Legionella busanensis]
MATRPEEVFKNDDSQVLTRASREFRYRKEGNFVKDGRDFKTWYHIDDAQRLVWKYYNDIKDNFPFGTNQSIKDVMLPPYVSFDDDRLNVVNFFSVLINFFQQAENQHKVFFPFMVKPETGGAHYIAGFLRRNPKGQVDIIIFNPIGLSKHDRIGTELAKLDKDSLNIANIISSPHTIQSTEKDNGPLVSCGPICVEFLRIAMSNLDWLTMLDKDFKLPPDLLAPLQEEYQEIIQKYRLKHDQLLTQVTETDLDQLDEDYKFIIEAMLNGLMTWLRQDSVKATVQFDEDDWFSEDNYGSESELYDASDEEEFSDEEENPDDKGELINTPSTSPNLKPEMTIITPYSSPKLSPQKQVENKMELEELNNSIIKKVENNQPQVSFDTNLNILEENNLNKSTVSSPSGVKYVQDEIDRLRKASKSFFAIRCEKKATLIETALQEAIRKGDDVRNDEGVRAALGYHRIFSFFGLKKADALQHIEESLNPPKNQL